MIFARVLVLWTTLVRVPTLLMDLVPKRVWQISYFVVESPNAGPLKYKAAKSIEDRYILSKITEISTTTECVQELNWNN